MKISKVSSFSNLLKTKATEPSTPSARGRGNFDDVLDISPLKASKENKPPFSANIRVYRTPVASSFPHSDAKNDGNFLDLGPSKSNSFFRLPSPRFKSRKDEPLRPEHISRPRLSPQASTPSFKPSTPSSAHSQSRHREAAPSPNDDYFSHRATSRVEPYRERLAPPQTPHQSKHHRSPRAPQLSSYKSTPALSSHRRAHAKVPSNKNPRPDLPMNALEYEREFNADFADSTFDPSTSSWDRMYHFKDLPGRGAESKPLMLVERRDCESPRYSFDNVSLAANHGIESSPYCF